MTPAIGTLAGVLAIVVSGLLLCALIAFWPKW